MVQSLKSGLGDYGSWSSNVCAFTSSAVRGRGEGDGVGVFKESEGSRTSTFGGKRHGYFLSRTSRRSEGVSLRLPPALIRAKGGETAHGSDGKVWQLSDERWESRTQSEF